MDKQLFNNLLKSAGLSKKEFGEILGTTGATISNWGNEGREIPYWVESWLKLYIENIQCKKLRKIIKESGVCENIAHDSL
jgi:DNA-binding XRE family transcriptional regulator